MKILKEAIVEIDKPFFIYNKVEMKVKVYPKPIKVGSTSVTTFDPTVDEVVIMDTIEEVNAEFESLGFKVLELDMWDYPAQIIRVFLSDTDLMDMLSTYPQFSPFIEMVKDTTIKRNGGRWIYLSELFPEHKELFGSYTSFKYEEHGV